MSPMVSRIYAREEDFYRYNQNAIKVMDMARWVWYYPSVGEREVRLYIVEAKTAGRKTGRFYVMLCQGPRPNGDYAMPNDPNEPPPPPDHDGKWCKLTDLPFAWWQDMVLQAEFDPPTEGFIKHAPVRCFEAEFDPQDNDWAAPTLLHVVPA